MKVGKKNVQCHCFFSSNHIKKINMLIIGQQQQPQMYSCTYMKKLQRRGKLNEVRVLAAWNNHRG